MIDGIPLALVGDVGAPALVTLFVLLVLFRKLVPEKTLKDEQERTARTEDLNHKNLATIATQAETIRVLSGENMASFAKVIGAIQDKAGVEQ